ncbi:lantibiotic dehydratase [Thermocatellispora tengchongensis]|uniref:lantibiotic dehydratase n=1 Tax=Thermocatellispora tengchongensis TaxID=1073253 RepID=UPI0036336911
MLCSADVMVAAPALEAYEPGRTPLVLGDIHDAALLTPWALQFHPDAAALTAARDDAIERALTGFTALNVIARRGGGLPPLEFPGPVLELGGVAADPRRRRIGLDTLFVHSDGERAELRAHGLAGPLLFHNGELDTAVHTALALPRIRRPALPDLPYIPRLTWDNVVVSRRRWLIGRDRFDALGAAPGDSGRLVAMARLRAEHDLPGAFFASSPAERKPIYVDSRAPALLDGLVRLARTADRLTLTETLPGPEECWLRDGGLRFAAELRCVYLRPPRAPRGRSAGGPADRAAAHRLHHRGRAAARRLAAGSERAVRHPPGRPRAAAAHRPRRPHGRPVRAGGGGRAGARRVRLRAPARRGHGAAPGPRPGRAADRGRPGTDRGHHAAQRRRPRRRPALLAVPPRDRGGGPGGAGTAGVRAGGRRPAASGRVRAGAGARARPGHAVRALRRRARPGAGRHPRLPRPRRADLPRLVSAARGARPWRPAEPVAWIDGTRLPRASGAWAGWLDAGRVAALLPSALSAAAA